MQTRNTLAIDTSHLHLGVRISSIRINTLLDLNLIPTVDLHIIFSRIFHRLNSLVLECSSIEDVISFYFRLFDKKHRSLARTIPIIDKIMNEFFDTQDFIDETRYIVTLPYDITIEDLERERIFSFIPEEAEIFCEKEGKVLGRLDIYSVLGMTTNRTLKLYMIMNTNHISRIVYTPAVEDRVEEVFVNIRDHMIFTFKNLISFAHIVKHRIDMTDCIMFYEGKNLTIAPRPYNPFLSCLSSSTLRFLFLLALTAIGNMNTYDCLIFSLSQCMGDSIIIAAVQKRIRLMKMLRTVILYNLLIGILFFVIYSLRASTEIMINNIGVFLIVKLSVFLFKKKLHIKNINIFFCISDIVAGVILITMKKIYYG